MVELFHRFCPDIIKNGLCVRKCSPCYILPGKKATRPQFLVEFMISDNDKRIGYGKKGQGLSSIADFIQRHRQINSLGL